MSAAPWLFVSQECVYRLDGHHRASIARFLGLEKIPARVIYPEMLLTLDDIPEKYRSYLVSLSKGSYELENFQQ